MHTLVCHRHPSVRSVLTRGLCTVLNVERDFLRTEIVRKKSRFLFTQKWRQIMKEMYQMERDELYEKLQAKADGGGSNKTSAGERGKCVAGGADKGCDAGVFGAVL